MSGLEAAWTILEDEPRSRSGWYSRRILPEAACVIRAGLREPVGTRALLLEVPAGAVPTGTEWPECVGFVVGPEMMVPGPGGAVRICLEERSPLWRELFTVMATQVSQHIAQAAGPPAAVAILLSRLAAWQRFMSENGPGPLSEEARTGLVAELLFLEREVLTILPVAEALAAWQGPSKAPQDFRFPAGLVEVKGSTAAAPASFRVANLEQLSGAGGLPVLLCHLSMSLAGVTARTLPEIVDELRALAERAGAATSHRLEDLLFQAGYLDAHISSYRTPAYEVRALTRYLVSEGFPRLTPETVPPGVSAATYMVSLSACAPYEVDATRAALIIGSPNV
ncbi:PD-(D/E)XK motif protein [Phenylobacterium conjunctum]|uniref:PD-(D/E)XK motif protein n=1 Tax=Phenylobacterium conjunctum TaxID=1298959 RepID=A0ABW3T463_9CAUL